LHFNRCLTAEYSEATAHFNGSFSTDTSLRCAAQVHSDFPNALCINVFEEGFKRSIETEKRIGLFNIKNLAVIICLFVAHNISDEGV
jgi:hypothetical protein